MKYYVTCHRVTPAHELVMFSTSVCTRPAVVSSPYYATRSAHSTVGYFLLLAQLSGTHCLTCFGIQSFVQTVAEDVFILCSTNVSSALEVSCENVQYKFTLDI